MNFRGGFSQKLYVRCLWGPWIRLPIPSQKFGANERKTFLDLAETDAVSYHAIHYKVIQTLINNRLHFSRCYWYKRLYNLAQGIRYIDTVTYTVNSNGLNSGLTFCLLTELGIGNNVRIFDPENTECQSELKLYHHCMSFHFLILLVHRMGLANRCDFNSRETITICRCNEIANRVCNITWSNFYFNGENGFPTLINT